MSILYRVKDYDKERGNWYYLRFNENGTVSKGDDKKALAGKVASCIECHAKAGGKDYVFSGDEITADAEILGTNGTAACLAWSDDKSEVAHELG